MKRKNFLAVTLVGLITLSGCGVKESPPTAPETTDSVTEAETEAATEAATEAVTETPQASEDEVFDYVTDEYSLVWADEFNDYEGELSKDDWNYEAHQVGWVNSELQKYVASSDYAFV